MISGGEKKFNEVAVNDAKKKVLFLLLWGNFFYIFSLTVYFDDHYWCMICRYLFENLTNTYIDTMITSIKLWKIESEYLHLKVLNSNPLS